MTVTVSVTVRGLSPPRQPGVTLDPPAVMVNVEVGFGGGAAGSAADSMIMVVFVGLDEGVEVSEDDGRSLGNEMTNGLCVDVVDGT